MRFVANLRAIETEDGTIHLVGPTALAIEVGSRVVIVPVMKPTSEDVDFQMFASPTTTT